MDDEDLFIEPEHVLPINALYDLCWHTWFDCFDSDENIHNPCPVGDKTDTINLRRDD